MKKRLIVNLILVVLLMGTAVLNLSAETFELRMRMQKPMQETSLI